MKRIYLLIISLLALSSCQTDLDIPFPEHEPQLVLNSFLVEDGSFFLYVTRSFSALENVNGFDDSALVVQDAEVSIWKDGEKLSDFEFYPAERDTFIYEVEPGTGIMDTFINIYNVWVYLPTTQLPPPKAGETYEYRASHPVYGEAVGRNTVLPEPQVLDVDIVIDSLTSTDFDGYQDNWTAMKVRVLDPGDLLNYYSFSGIVSYTSEFPDGSGGTIQDTLIQGLQAATDIVNEGGTVYGEFRPISDADFNGMEKTLIVYFRLPGCCGYPSDLARPGNEELLSINLQTFIMDADFGVYNEKLRLQSESRTVGIEGAIIPREPVSVVGNVEGGYGMIGSFNGNLTRIDF